MSQARRTRHFARSAKRGEEKKESFIFFATRAARKMPRSPRLAQNEFALGR